MSDNAEHGPQHAQRARPAAVEAVEVAEETSRQAYSGSFQEHVVTDGADVHPQDVASRYRPRSAAQVSLNAKCPRHVHDAAKGHDAQRGLRIHQRFAGLSYGAVATGGDDQLAAVAHGLPGEPRRVSWRTRLLQVETHPGFFERLLYGLKRGSIGWHTQLAPRVRVHDQPRRRI